MTNLTVGNDRIASLLGRLSEKSVEDYYNPFTHFDWAESLPDDVYWMTPELLSVAGTEAANEITAEDIQKLSKWESINFYSMNVHGIRELIMEVVRRIHMPGFELPSEFFHHFIGEENEHMWFFSEFCLRYGKKIYPTLQAPVPSSGSPALANLLVFARILIFEEVVDHYNVTMASDGNLHPTIREVNRVHHKDESRHIAFGRELVASLFADAKEKLDEAERANLETYLKRYLLSILNSFSNPRAYRDAGLTWLTGRRSEIIASSERRAAYRHIARKPLTFLVREGLISDPTLPEAV
ncbi:diiron oxygenase [Mycobacterium sp. CBMA271]|uniref:diiron oxygenase n=1 Tax=unclassified Mycobacteroides TaxID=2618759 RepID=UPI0012DF26B5|nr:MULTISPECIES: diiron oxygenase [unclassified Mycobacteroides]MUM18785.1 AurF domain containing protein [Mycobacteroides sp. CBMA 326]MUM22748.1 diiron oxygenase [Mycobacteroides sp. CBMA 271]